MSFAHIPRFTRSIFFSIASLVLVPACDSEGSDSPAENDDVATEDNGEGTAGDPMPTGGEKGWDTDRLPRQARFQLRNEFNLAIPKGSQKVRIWIPLPQSGSSAFPSVAASTIENLQTDAGGHDVVYTTDSEGNAIGYLEVNYPQPTESDSQILITQSFDLLRQEVLNGWIDPQLTRVLQPQEYASLAQYLLPSAHVPSQESRFQAIAQDIVGSETNPVQVARLVYDWILENIDYWVKDPDNKAASSLGDADHCLNLGAGNCTDFHSLFAALARASGVPTRMIYGGLLKDSLNGLDIDLSYHCWVEFFAPNLGWIPLDVSVADIWYGDNFANLSPEQWESVKKTAGSGFQGQANEAVVDYYFGNMDERRVVWSIGRDIELEPRQKNRPVNVMVKGYYEIDDQGKDWTWKNSAIPRQLTYATIEAAMGPAWPLE